MLLVVASDTHCGNPSSIEGTAPFSRADHEAFAAEMHGHKPDVLLVTGDCAEGMAGDDELEFFLRAYKNPHGDSICIPGNHDVWLGRDDFNAEEKYKRFAYLAKQAGWIPLVNEPYQFKNSGIWIAGNMCWYDFSHIDHGVDKTPHDYEMERLWSDYFRMRFQGLPLEATPMMDYCAKRMAEFKECLGKVPKDRKFLVVASHFVGFPRLLSFFRNADYSQTFMANNNIGVEVAKADADIYTCGHTHRRQEFQLGKTRCLNNGSGYGFGSKRYDIIDIGLVLAAPGEGDPSQGV